MDRRSLIIAGVASLAAGSALAQGEPSSEYPTRPEDERPRDDQRPREEERPREEPGRDDTGPGRPAETYSRGEMVDRVSDFLGVTAESAGAAIEKMFKDNGRPTGYIAGEEGSGAVVVGLRYGRGPTTTAPDP